MAIRGSDVKKIGSLDFDDLQICLFNLEYLPQLKE